MSEVLISMCGPTFNKVTHHIRRQNDEMPGPRSTKSGHWTELHTTQRCSNYIFSSYTPFSKLKVLMSYTEDVEHSTALYTIQYEAVTVFKSAMLPMQNAIKCNVKF